MRFIIPSYLASLKKLVYTSIHHKFPRSVAIISSLIASSSALSLLSRACPPNHKSRGGTFIVSTSGNEDLRRWFLNLFCFYPIDTRTAALCVLAARLQPRICTCIMVCFRKRTQSDLAYFLIGNIPSVQK